MRGSAFAFEPGPSPAVEIFRRILSYGVNGLGDAMEIALDTVCFVISKARELVIEERDADDDDDDEEIAAFASSPEVDELKEFIDTLDDNEQAELIALAWIGQGTFTEEDWDEAVESALEDHPKGAADYLLSLALLADDLESGLSAFGLSCDDKE